MDFRIRGAQPGEKDWRFELRMRDSVQETTGRVMQRFQRIDRGENVYYERVHDLATGEVVHETSEPLSEHRDRGSARRVRRN